VDGDKGVRLIADGHRGGEEVHRDAGGAKIPRHQPGDAQVHVGLRERPPAGAGVAAKAVLLVGQLLDVPVSRLDAHAPGHGDPARHAGRRGGEESGHGGRQPRRLPGKPHAGDQLRDRARGDGEERGNRQA